MGVVVRVRTPGDRRRGGLGCPTPQKKEKRRILLRCSRYYCSTLSMRKFVSETNAVLLLFITLPQYLIQSCARGGRSIVENMCYEIRRAEALVCETREEPGTLTQGGALFSLGPLVWESNPKLQGGWCKPNHQPIGGSDPNHQGIWSSPTAGLCV